MPAGPSYRQRDAYSAYAWHDGPRPMRRIGASQLNRASAELRSTRDATELVPGNSTHSNPFSTRSDAHSKRTGTCSTVRGCCGNLAIAGGSHASGIAY